MSNAISARVPYECPRSYDLLFVGEAPGEEEARLGRPFIGKSGELLERYLNRNGISRDEVGLANVYGFRPRGNVFESILGESNFQEELERLKDEITRGQPKCIVALGGWPMYFLTGACTRKGKKEQPGVGISLYRGSRLKSTFGKHKVFCSYHPAYILRNWHENPVFNIDLVHAIEDSKFPELRKPKYDEFIDPRSDVAQDLAHEAIKSGLVAVDIETFPDNRFSCIGFAWKFQGGFQAMCLTFKNPTLWPIAQEIWESQVPKIFQYGTYDISFMRMFYNWRVGGYYDGLGWDTFLASASIIPDFPRGLDFLCSIYTRFPYYKTERKVWKEVGDMSILWKYNIKDCVATYQIYEEQQKEIKELFG